MSRKVAEFTREQVERDSIWKQEYNVIKREKEYKIEGLNELSGNLRVLWKATSVGWCFTRANTGCSFILSGHR